MTRRTAIVSAFLLTLSALAAAPAVFGQSSSSHEQVPMHLSEVRFDGSHLPGESGWFALAVRADQDAWITVETELPLPRDAARAHRAYLLLAVEGRSGIPVAGWTGGSAQPPVASASTRFGGTACCEPLVQAQPGEPGSMGVSELYLHAGETLLVGFMGANLDVATGEAVVRAFDADLKVVDVLSGSNVELVDLRERAREHGAHVEAFGRTLLSRPSSVTLEWGGRGFLNVDAYAWGDARATLSVTTPSGVHLDQEVLAEEWAQVVAYETGQFQVTLEGLREPVELLHDRGEVSVEVFYADLGLPGEGLDWWIGG